ncbi:putative NADH-dependent flavin oxidoreductase [Rana grylio virus]|uniref:Putative NADH-dependent flavin oxidoreductase n=1 Tax=Rana grylio virus TaxID=380178 RepID=H9XFH1_FRG3V|nr:putative NADH-dependent flavin oxidoreductase [Rana grylio virus]
MRSIKPLRCCNAHGRHVSQEYGRCTLLLFREKLFLQTGLVCNKQCNAPNNDGAESKHHGIHHGSRGALALRGAGVHLLASAALGPRVLAGLVPTGRSVQGSVGQCGIVAQIGRARDVAARKQESYCEK